jgi:hypothetical protein
LSTDTGSTSITSPENVVEGSINSYRQTALGNVGAGGGGVGGGVAVGNTTGIILSGHFGAKKSARAHCKHLARDHQASTGFPFTAGANPEGDSLRTSTNPSTGTPANLNPKGNLGRLGKVGISCLPPPPLGVEAMAVSGTAFDTADEAFRQLVTLYGNALTIMGWTHFAVGHWRGGGPDGFYWHVIFMNSPSPQQ